MKYIVVGYTEAKNKNKTYKLIGIHDTALTVDDINLATLANMARNNDIINYNFNFCSYRPVYVQGAERKLDLTKRIGRFTRAFVVKKLIKNNKEVGFDIVIVRFDGNIITDTSIHRVDYLDALYMLKQIDDMINVKIVNDKICAIAGKIEELYY